MDQIITPDCPQCGGFGRVPMSRDSVTSVAMVPCGQCCRRWDLANPCPSPKFMRTNMTMAQFTKSLRTASERVRGVFGPAYGSKAAHDPDLHESHMEDLEWFLGAAADFVASHDPSTKILLTEEQAPYCNECEYDHVPGACGQ